jgi:hypothetical protein
VLTSSVLAHAGPGHQGGPAARRPGLACLDPATYQQVESYLQAAVAGGRALPPSVPSRRRPERGQVTLALCTHRTKLVSPDIVARAGIRLRDLQEQVQRGGGGSQAGQPGQPYVHVPLTSGGCPGVQPPGVKGDADKHNIMLQWFRFFSPFSDHGWLPGEVQVRVPVLAFSPSVFFSSAC